MSANDELRTELDAARALQAAMARRAEVLQAECDASRAEAAQTASMAADAAEQAADQHRQTLEVHARHLEAQRDAQARREAGKQV